RCWHADARPAGLVELGRVRRLAGADIAVAEDALELAPGHRRVVPACHRPLLSPAVLPCPSPCPRPALPWPGPARSCPSTGSVVAQPDSRGRPTAEPVGERRTASAATQSDPLTHSGPPRTRRRRRAAAPRPRPRRRAAAPGAPC